MQAHQQFILQLQTAARQGGDLLPILEQNRAHILGCPACRANLAGFEQDFYAGLMARLEEEGKLQQPAGLPDIDLNFLLSGLPPLWKTGGAREKMARVLMLDNLSVQLDPAGKTGAFFSGLPAQMLGLLASHQPAAAKQRSAAALGAGQSTLFLPDSDQGVEIQLNADSSQAGRLDLTVKISQDSAPVEDAQARLAGSAGSQISHARQGEVVFHQVKPGSYTLEIKLLSGSKAGAAWTLALTVIAEGENPSP